MLRTAKTRRVLFAAAASVVAMSSIASAQTSGSWILEADGSWSDATKWSPAVPDGGGVATFNTPPTFVINAPRTVRQDLANVTLDKIVYNTPFTFNIIPNVAGNTITLTGSAEVTHTVAPTFAWNTTTNGQLLGTTLAGSAGLNRTGPGIVSLTIANTFTGNVSLSGSSTTRITVGDGAFGNAANQINMNDGTIRVGSAVFTTSRQINLLAGGTIETTATGAANINGVVTGAGSFNKVGSSSLAFTASNDYTGRTWVGAGSIIYSGNGAATNTSSIDASGTITLDNTATNNSARINDAAGITFRGAGINLIANAAGSSETLGVATFAQGISNITVTPNATGGGSLTFAQSQRTLGGAAFFRANGLGQAPAVNVGNIYFTAPPTLSSSGGGAPGSTQLSIIPWAYGIDSSTGTVANATTSLVTYGANGVRPLAPSEYLADFTTSTLNDNVRVASAQNVAGTVNASALAFTTGGSLTGSGTVALASGVLLNSAAGTTVAPNIDFGSNEGILHTPNNITFNGVFAGSGGLTKTSDGAATFANNASTYTGTTTIGGGTAFFTSSVTSGGPGVFGSDTSAIVLSPGAATGGRILYSGAGNASFDRNLNVRASSLVGNQVLLPRFGVTAGQTLEVNGNVDLAFPLSISGTAGANVIFDGNISGSGFITDQAITGGTITFNGNNTFDNGIEAAGSNTWAIGSDTALGTGKIKFVQLSGQPTFVAVGGARVVPNDVVALTLVNNFWTIGGANDITFTGAITLANLNVGGVGTHNITNTGVTTYAGQLSIGGFNKIGAGTLVLSGNNIHNGIGTVAVGALRVTSDNALGTPLAGTVVNTGAALEITSNAQSTEPVTIGGSGLPGNAGAIRSISGNNTLGNITLPATASVGVDAGTLTVGNVAGNFDFFKVGAGHLAANRYRVGGMTVTGSAGVTLGRDGPGKVSTVAGVFSFNTGATFDLGDNDLILNTASVNDIVGRVVTARNGGTWDGPGLTSSAARIMVPKITTLGVLSGAEYIAVNSNSFDGITVNPTDVLVRYTYYGDTDFNGIVNFDDYSRIDNGFSNGLTGWLNGDVDFSGGVTFDDYALVDLAFNTQQGTLARAVSFLNGTDPSSAGMGSSSLQEVVEHFGTFGQPYANAFLNSVPEPTGAIALGGLVALAGKRRRRRSI